MNEKEIAEIRRRFRSDKTNISRVCGCFVNEKKEIISEFDQSVGMMPEEEADRTLSLLKKTLSGTPKRNLLEIEFSTDQVMNSEEHKLLTDLRSTELTDKELVRKLYDKIISSLELEGNYMILLAHDRYDVFDMAADGAREEESRQMFSYIVCAICPTKEGKPTLSYYVPGNCLRSVCADTVLSSTELGFMFPAFDDRATNIYKAIYYTRSITDSHKELVDALFSSSLPMPAAEQKTTFGSILAESAAEECNLRVVRSVHSQLCHLIEEHKNEKKEEPLVINKSDAGDMLRYCGVDEEKIESFEKSFDEKFGESAEISPKNIADAKHISIKTPDVTIKVNAGCGDLVEARVIDGVKYILVRAEDGVELNGINIEI